QRVLKLDPTSASATINSGRIALMLGQREEAVQALLLVNEASSLPPQLRLDLAAALLLVGEVRRSMAVVETLPANAKSSTALPLLGAVYLRSAQFNPLTSLVPAMKKAAFLNPPLAIACAQVLQDASQFKEAIEILLAVRNFQNEIAILVSLARLEVFTK